MPTADGMSYAPKGKPAPVCQEGDFVFAAVGLDHGHIYGMCNGLTEAGGRLKWAYDPDPAKTAALAASFPGVQVARSENEVLEDPGVQLVAGAAVPADHADLGLRVMAHGKDYFTDKPALTTLDQLAQARLAVESTGRKYAVYYAERVHVESAVLAGQLVLEGALGRVLQVIGLGPHRANLASRPPWFFERERYGGILCDLGSHQVEQFLWFTGNSDARVAGSQVANYAHKDRAGLEDFGDCHLVGENGATGYFRVDWFTPDGLSGWGDGRTFILGTLGYMELRKYLNVGMPDGGNHIYLVDAGGEHHLAVSGQVGYPFFGELILDCLERTEHAMPQAHTFKAAELCVVAEQEANRTE